MQLHDILVVVLILERKGSETDDGLEIALNHKTAQTQPMNFEFFRSHVSGETSVRDFQDVS